MLNQTPPVMQMLQSHHQVLPTPPGTMPRRPSGYDMPPPNIKDGNNNRETTPIDMLCELSKDKLILMELKRLGVKFNHLEDLIDKNILNQGVQLIRDRGIFDRPQPLPEGHGTPVKKTLKIEVPKDTNHDFNYVGRILGPKGMTTKLLEEDTGCRIMIRGKGSLRDPAREEKLIQEDEVRRGEKWLHLKEALHVLIEVEDTENRCMAKLERAEKVVHRLLQPIKDEQDDLLKTVQQQINAAIAGRDPKEETKEKPRNQNPYGIIPIGIAAPGLLVGPSYVMPPQSQQISPTPALIQNVSVPNSQLGTTGAVFGLSSSQNDLSMFQQQQPQEYYYQQQPAQMVYQQR